MWEKSFKYRKNTIDFLNLQNEVKLRILKLLNKNKNKKQQNTYKQRERCKHST